MKRAIALLLFALVGCAPPTVPDVTYFRLPPATALPIASIPLPLPVVVDVFSADGIYAEQALLYSLTPEASSLRAYHYQLWTDPPARLLQRRLIDQLRDAKISTLITDRLTNNVDSLRIKALIRRFDRVKQTDGWLSVVRVQFRVDRGEASAPLLLRDYDAELPVTQDALSASVQSLGAVIDRIFAEFAADLLALQVKPNAG